MGSWLSTQLHAQATTVLQCGEVPRHVAFIMDGNRRYARRQGVETIQGHSEGFSKLKEVCQWGLNLGIEVMTVYAFSIENFKRPQAEVDQLMALATDRFRTLLAEHELIQREGIRIRVLGNLHLLPPALQRVIARAVDCSKHNTRAVLNVCFAYTAQDEILSAARDAVTAVQAGQLQTGDISEELLTQSLLTEDMPAPELLVRTSGEVRLSDFLLWQAGYSCLCFSTVLWPQFTFWHFVAALLYYQRHATDARIAAQAAAIRAQQRQQAWNRQALTPGHFLAKVDEDVAKVEAERMERVGQFLATQRHRRTLQVEAILGSELGAS